jgi:PKD repeat protein
LFIFSAFASIPMAAEDPETIPYVEWEVELRTLPAGGEPSAPQVEDLDRDGTPEIVVTSGDSVYALRPDGTTKWRFTIYGIVTGAIAGDINNDGKAEVVAGTEEGVIYCFNHEGTQMWTFNASAPVKAIPALADLDDDDKMEVIVGTTNGDLFVIGSGGAKIWEAALSSGIHDSVSIGHLGYLGPDLEVVVGTDDSKYHVLNYNGSLQSTFDISSSVAGGTGILDLPGITKDLVAGTVGGTLLLTGAQQTNWTGNLSGPATAPVIIDLDGDALQELVIGDSSGKVHQFVLDGTPKWQYGFSSGVAGISGVLAPDPSLIVTLEDGEIAFLSNEGAKVWSFPLGIECAHPAAAADVDGDHEMELIVTGKNGMMISINTHQSLIKDWPMAGHDIRNTRALDSLEDGKLPWNLMWKKKTDDFESPISAMLIDVDGNEDKEVVLFLGALLSTNITVREANGELRDNYVFGNYLHSSPLAADLAGNTGKEIAFLSESGVYTYWGNLTPLWYYEMWAAMPMDAQSFGLAASNVIGDAKYEVFAGNLTGDVVGLYPNNGSVIWSDNVGSGVTSLTVADLYTDGNQELMATTESGIMFVMNASDGTPLWASKAFPGKAVPPVVADLDGDSLIDVALGTPSGALLAYHGNGTLLWEKDIVGGVIAAMAIHGEGNGLDLVVKTSDDKVLFIDGDDGGTISDISIDTPDHYFPGTEFSAAYTGTDGPLEIFTSYLPDDDLAIINKERNSVELTDAPGFAVVFEDLETDGTMEMVTGGSPFTIEQYGTELGPGVLSPWTMDGHDASRTYNPFYFDGEFIPDLRVGPADIKFDPPLINKNATHKVNITYHNKGAIESGPFDINITSNGEQVTFLSVPSLAAFSEGEVSLNWKVGYENQTLEVEIDPEGEVEEVYEDNNMVSRTLFINMPPTVDAGPDLKSQPGDKLVFDGNISNDLDGPIVNYTWDFDDGFQAEGSMVYHTFDSSGIYNVTLTVTDYYGLTAVDNATVHVNFAPLFMEYNPKGDPTMNEGEGIDFYALATDPDGDPVTVEWSLDGHKVGEGPTWSWWANYSSSGVHAINVTASDGNLSTTHIWKLTVTDSFRLIDGVDPMGKVTIPQGRSQTFLVRLSQQGQGSNIEWFIDGETVQTGSTAFNLFAGEGSQGDFELMVEVKGENGRDFHIWDVTIGPVEDSVRIRWTYPESDTVSTNFGEPVWFGVSAEGGSIQWHIDGTAALGEDGESFKFDTWGNATYNVTVTVTSETDMISSSWTLAVNYPPIPKIVASKLVVKKGKKVNLDGSGSRDHEVDGTIISHEWELGDGTRHNGTSLDHRYTKAGTYTVTLTVTDNKGLSAQTSVTIVVKAEERATPGFGTLLVVAAIIIALIVGGHRRRRRFGR